MFSKKKGQITTTVIGPGAKFSGDLEVADGLKIDGTLTGNINAEGLVAISEGGEVNGEIVADMITIAGKVDGQVTAREMLHMQKGGEVKGEVTYGTLQVDPEAVIEGRTTRISQMSTRAQIEREPEEVPQLTEGSLPEEA